MAAKTITQNAIAEAADVQRITFTKEPGKPIQVTVQIGTDQAPPHDREYAEFPLSEVPSGAPSLGSLKAVRDYALTKLGFV